MIPNRNTIIWGTLGICALAIITGMGWLTHRSIEHQKISMRAEANQRYAEARADIEERTRLSLWRLDAFAAGLLLAENQTPTDSYLSSSIIGSYENTIHCRFEVTGDSEVSIGNNSSPKKLKNQQVQNLITALPAKISFCTPAFVAPEKSVKKSIPSSWKGATKSEIDSYQTSSNINEKTARSKAFENTNRITQQIQLRQGDNALLADSLSPFEAIWHNGELFLWRSIQKDQKKINQGAWIDEGALAKRLLQEVNDLLPNAKLVPILRDQKAENPLALVSLPYLLVTNETPILANLPPLRTDYSLWIAWAGALLALIACAILIRGVIGLSERRASFVSAVTHELRTPLTTFKLYTDILQTKTCKPEKSEEYLQVLSRESDRLGHLVENVLIFSKMERGSARAQTVTGDAYQLITPMLDRFKERLEPSKLTLVTHYPTPFKTSVDISKVEHILFNLIDNAAKYASSSLPPEVSLELRQEKSSWHITVRDHGPGVTGKEKAKIFQAFHKSATRAAETQPGVGLGLALSLRLARSMQGTLTYSDAEAGGACFTLTLPHASGTAEA